jgi:predicted phage gp36 major capsid-like protein
MREVAKVETTAFNEKRFVASTGVTTAWYAEEAEVADHSPSLLQPTITCCKAISFVPVSFALYGLGHRPADRRPVRRREDCRGRPRVHHRQRHHRAEGDHHRGLRGRRVGARDGTNTLANGDVYASQNALPARWRPRARFMANLSIISGYRQLIKAAGLTESLVDDSGPVPRMAGWEVRENSNMDGTLTATAADYLLLCGDFQQYAIVDRVATTSS